MTTPPAFFSGDLKSVIVENRDDDVLKELTMDVVFFGKGQHHHVESSCITV